jgi:DNA-binding MarR family transcriptional regulator
MKMRCHHEVKIEVLLKLFEPMTKKTIAKKAKIKPKKLNRILENFKERNLIRELKGKNGVILYHTTPKGKKLVKHFKDVIDHLEGKEAFPHIFDYYNY